MKIDGLSIGQKVAMVLLSVSFIAVLLTAAIFYFKSQTALRKITVEHLLSVSSQQYYQVLQSLDRSRDQLALITSRTQLRLSLHQWLARKREKTAQDPLHLNKMKKILHDAKQSVPNIIDLVILDLDGNYVVSTITEPNNKVELIPNFAEQNFTNGEPFRVTVIAGELGDNQLAYTQPLILEGKVIGYLVLRSDLSSYNQILLNHKGLGETEEAFLVYRNKAKQVLPLTQLKFSHSPSAQINIDPFTIALETLNPITVYNDYRNQDVFAVTRVFPNTDWGLIFKIDQEDAMKEVISQRNFILVALLISSVLVLLIAVFLSRSLTRSVVDMVEVATVIAQGDLSKRIKKLSNDELGFLAMAINQMADKLIDANLHLEKRIEDKTSELTLTNNKLQKLSEELQKRALEDGLTQVANRRAFDEGITSEWKRCQRTGSELSLIMLDVDFFKLYNDSLGHKAGDKCLYTIAQLLRQFGQREGDVVARYGGEEFVLLLPNTSPDDCFAVAERVRKAVAEEKIGHPKSTIGDYVTVSVGCGTLIPNDISNVTVFIQTVDVALYRAKKNGRNRVEIANVK